MQTNIKYIQSGSSYSLDRNKEEEYEEEEGGGG